MDLDLGLVEDLGLGLTPEPARFLGESPLQRGGLPAPVDGDARLVVDVLQSFANSWVG